MEGKRRVKPYEIGELDQYLLGQGNHYEIYKKLGAHLVEDGDKKGTYFAVWAPNAQKVSVIGEFNDWDLTADVMERNDPVGIYTCFVEGAKENEMYKFCIETKKGELLYKADPYANYAELRPGTASRITDISKIKWTDKAWMDQRLNGTPEDFAWMINYLHKNKIGVILDWVPAHFPKDAHGLADFDGAPEYEYADPRMGEHPDWGTKIFDFGKNEVKNFLISNALFWIEHFHIDGLRVDAVASILYLDYGKKDGEWVPNEFGGNKNLQAVEFFKHLNSVVLGRNPGAVMIAEESTAWPKVTGEVEDDGLGFSLKWNMGWMHDFTEYMKLDPLFRKGAHYNMTFAMSYAYSEKYILVLSHDEVVHLKCSMINKMPGLGWEKFENLKAAYAFMMGHSGKKLLFMGQDFAQLREWSEKRELDWYLLAEKEHQQMQSWVRDLLHLYRRRKAFYEQDNTWEGFEWINADDRDRSIYSFVRHAKGGKQNLLFVISFTPVAREDYRVGVPKRKQYRLILNSDEEKYGGTGKKRPAVYKAEKSECDGRPYSFAYPLPAYGVAIFEF